MKKRIRNLFFIALFFIVAPALSFAASAVQIDYIGAPAPIFNIGNMSPGQTFTKLVTATNNATTNQMFKFSVTPSGISSALASQTLMKITNVLTGVEKYSGPLSSIYSAGEISLDVLAPASPTVYDFTVIMNPDAGNTYMGLTERFDMTVGFDATPTSQPATTVGTSAPAGFLTSLATSLGFTPTDSGAVIAGAQAGETPAVKGAQDTAVKGSTGVTCPWWWIVALVLTAVLAFLGGALRALEPAHFLRKYFYLWPPILASAAWVAHQYLHGLLQSTWFCNNYWLVMLVAALLGEAAFAWIVRSKD